tara:strand:+ start:645 stop:827 length:183 start_codon:yes stop_codon:yes gene_type:complete
VTINKQKLKVLAIIKFCFTLKNFPTNKNKEIEKNDIKKFLVHSKDKNSIKYSLIFKYNNK